MLTNPTSEGTCAVLVCQVQANFIIDSNELRIKELKFIGCGSNEFSSVRNFTIENSTFEGQNDSETALDITDSNLTAVNGLFLSNRVGTCMDVFDANIESDVSVRICWGNSCYQLCANFWRIVMKLEEQYLSTTSVTSESSTALL